MSSGDFLANASANALGTVVGGVALAALTGLFVDYVKVVGRMPPTTVRGRSANLELWTKRTLILTIVLMVLCAVIAFYASSVWWDARQSRTPVPGWAQALHENGIVFAWVILGSSGIPAALGVCAGVHGLTVWAAEWRRRVDAA